MTKGIRQYLPPNLDEIGVTKKIRPTCYYCRNTNSKYFTQVKLQGKIRVLCPKCKRQEET